MRYFITANVADVFAVVRSIVRADVAVVVMGGLWSLLCALGLLKRHAGLWPTPVPVTVEPPTGPRRERSSRSG